MASIFDNKYGEGDAFTFSTKSKDLQQFKKAKVGDITKLVVTKSDEVGIGQLNEIFELGGNTPKTVYLRVGKKIVAIKGSEGKLKTLFNVASKKGTASTSNRTECSETTSLIIFKNNIENKKIIDEDSVIEQLKKMISKEAFAVYKSAYYESAIKQVNVFQKKMSLKSGYTYERQKQNITKVVYKNVAVSGGPKDPDNFNPGDLWIIKNDYAKKIEGIFSKFTNINELIAEIARAFNKREMISVSLKQTEKGAASAEIIDPADELKKNKTDIDLTISAVTIGFGGNEKIPFNNPTIVTKSGFTIRLTHKGSPILYFEGSFAKQDFQLGAIDSKKYNNTAEDKYGYKLKTKIPRVDQGVVASTLKELDELQKNSLFNQVTKKQTNDIKVYKDIFPKEGNTDIEKKARIFFSQFVSVMYYIFVKVPMKDRTTDKHMNFAYNLARKVQKGSSVYIKVIG